MAQSVVTLRAQMRFNRWTYICLLLLAATATSWGQKIEKRVLFVVETSKDSKPLAEAERKVVGALIETGIGGLLETNDSFGIWTYNEALYSGKFPAQRWSPEKAKGLAGQATDFLKAQTYVKTAKFESVRGRLQSVVESSPALMVILVTSGKPFATGTSFDAEINKELKAAYRSYQKEKSPAVIMFSSTSGKILRYSVSPAIGDVRVPHLTVPTNTLAKATVPTTKPPLAPLPIEVPQPARSEKALLITKGGAQTVSVAAANEATTEKAIPAENTSLNLAPELSNKTVVLPPKIISSVSSVETIKINPVIDPVPIEEPKPAELSVVSPEPKPTVEVIAPPKTVEAPPTVEAPRPVEVVAKPAEVIQTVAPPAPVPQETVKQVPSAEPPPVVAVAQVIQPKQLVETAAMVAPAIPNGSNPTEQTESNTTFNAGKAEVLPGPQPLIAQTAPEKKPFPFLMLAAGLVFLAVALAFLIGRQLGRKPQQSLVSDWAERDRLKKD